MRIARSIAPLVSLTVVACAVDPDIEPATVGDGKHDASSCTRVDLRAPLGPVRHQGTGSNWCFAETAADLATFRFQHELAGKRLTADVFAFAHAAAKDPEFAFSGGFIDGAIRDGVAYGRTRNLCLFGTDDREAMGASVLDITGRAVFVAELDEVADRGERARFMEKLAARRRTDPITKADPDVLYRVFREEESAALFARLALLLCAGGTWIPPHEVEVTSDRVSDEDWNKGEAYRVATAPARIELIDEQLDRGVPVGIDYMVSVTMFSTRPYGGLHASSIVGRRWNDDRGACEYLVRNSWGPACEPTDGEVLGGFRPDLLPGCEAGNFWLPYTDLTHSLFGVHYIEP